MKTKIKDKNNGNANGFKQTVFSQMMNFQCELRSELGVSPLPHWTATAEAPHWTKAICQNFRRTIFKSMLKLRPTRKFSWRNYGRSIGLMERYKTFLTNDAPQILEAEGFNKKISKKKWAEIEPLLGLEEMRQYYLKILKRPTNDETSMPELYEEVLKKGLANLEKHKEVAYLHIAAQGAKTTQLFLKGMSEGYTIFLNAEGEFSGDDRRTDIHLELLAWQYDIEKMRRVIPQKNNKHLVGELKKLPEFKNKSEDWFKEVFKDIKLSIGRRGRPPMFAGT